MRGYKRSNNIPTTKVVNNSSNRRKNIDLTTSLENKIHSLIKPVVNIVKPKLTNHKRPAIGKPRITLC